MQRRVVVLYLIFSLWVPISCAPAMAESPPLFDRVTLNRGFSVLAAVSRESSGLDPPNVATSQVFSLGRKGQWSWSQQHTLQLDPMPASQEERNPEWAKSHPSIGVAFQNQGWTAAIEYTRKNQSPWIDRGGFNSGKFFAGIGYQEGNVSAYLGLSRGPSAGIHWRGKDGDEAALTFVARSPNRDIRYLFDGQTTDPLRNVVTLTYRKPL